MMNYKKGSVVLVLFPNSDLVTAKRRPAVIVQSEGLDTGIDQVIVAMVTSNLNREGKPFRIRINKDTDDGAAAGILTDSIIMVDNMTTVRLAEIDKLIGAISCVDKLDGALKTVFALHGGIRV